MNLLIANVLLFVAATAAQVSVGAMPIPKMQFVSSTGAPLAGGMVYTYTCGTVTPLATYTDSNWTIPNGIPVILVARGYGNIWLGPKATSPPCTMPESFPNGRWTAFNPLLGQLPGRASP